MPRNPSARRDDDVVSPLMVMSIPIVDRVLEEYAPALGPDFVGYRNHVHRVVNLCLAFAGGSRDDLNKIAVAAAFHDLGIWTAHTFDYIPPSVSLAREYLKAQSRADWIPEIEAMIANHHKITRAQTHREWLVEGFRRADWVDVSCGFRRFGVPRSFIKTLFATWPSAGFHWRLVALTAAWFPRHPLTPLPMVKL
ncbi:MAG TPA: HD domain-containing protein [Vicinamibacterales bacterium]|nr:HD domain-containing protein [Vicinamibacterales bacterium]